MIINSRTIVFWDTIVTLYNNGAPNPFVAIDRAVELAAEFLTDAHDRADALRIVESIRKGNSMETAFAAGNLPAIACTIIGLTAAQGRFGDSLRLFLRIAHAAK